MHNAHGENFFLRIYPENMVVMWDDIVFNKEFYVNLSYSLINYNKI